MFITCQISKLKTKKKFFIWSKQLYPSVLGIIKGKRITLKRVKWDIIARNVLFGKHSILYLHHNQQRPGTVRICQLWVQWGSTSTLTLCEPRCYVCSCWAVAFIRISDDKGFTIVLIISNDNVIAAITGLIWTAEVKQQRVACRLVMNLFCVCTDLYWVMNTAGYTLIRKLKVFTPNAPFSFNILISTGVSTQDVLLTADDVIYHCRTEPLGTNSAWMTAVSLSSTGVKYPLCHSVAEGLPIIHSQIEVVWS